MLVRRACLLNMSVSQQRGFDSLTFRHLEEVRLVEDTVLKTAGCNRLRGSTPLSSVIRRDMTIGEVKAL